MHEEILKWVNKEREHLTLPPLDALPKGLTNHGCQCPIARCFPGSFVTGEELILNFGDEWREESLDLPYHVQVFTREFDLGSYPEFIEA